MAAKKVGIASETEQLRAYVTTFISAWLRYSSQFARIQDDYPASSTGVA
jgi:hypothetical protein